MAAAATATIIASSVRPAPRPSWNAYERVSAGIKNSPPFVCTRAAALVATVI